MLRQGSRGAAVTRLQQQLAAAGFNPGPIDGIFGPRTASAVREFQAAQNIQVDAIVGPITQGRLDAPAAATPAPAPTPAPTPVTPPPEEVVDVSPATEPEGATEGVGGAASFPGVLTGGELIKVERAGADDLWMMAYEWPAGSGKFVSWQFDNADQLESVFGANWWETIQVNVREEAFLDEVQVLDNADEIIGLKGSFVGLMQDTIRNAATIAGITDPTLVGQIVNNIEWQEIASQSALGEWTDAQTMAALRGTNFWQDTLYPGIDRFYGRTTEPEQLWASYDRTVKSSLIALGYEPDPDGSFRTIIGEMLNKGVNEDAFVANTGTFIRAEQSPGFREALNQWTEAKLGREVNFDEWFDLLAGQGTTEIAEVAELANLQFAADRAGLRIAAQQLENLAGALDLTEEQAFAAFNQAERSLLAIGDENLQRYGLSQADLVSASAGILPESGRSIEEVRRQARKAATELALTDDVKSALFVGFSERGTPERPGLEALAPEGA